MSRRTTPATVLTAALTVALLLAVLALGGCQTKVVTSDGATPLNTVTAAGTGTASAAPDEAEMTFGVTNRAEKADDALRPSTDKAKAIIDAVKKAGVDDKDVQTAAISVYPEYANQDEGNTPQITGYSATISVRAKIRNVDKVGDVIGAAVDAGANEIGGPTFTIGDDSDARDTAIEQAIEDAKRRAETMAKAAGKSLGTIIAVSETGTTAIPYYAKGAYDTAEALRAAVPIEPGQLDVTANVTVVFELK
jgi:hypothetical protein